MLNPRPSFSTGLNAMPLLRNHLGVAIVVVVVLVLTIIVTNFHPADPLFSPSASTSTVGAVNQASFASLINITGADLAEDSNSETLVASTELQEASSSPPIGNCTVHDPINCSDFDVFHALMQSAIEAFTDINFHRFGKPVRGENRSSCHMAWRFTSKEASAPMDKDYRSFTVVKSENCTIRVAAIGDYRSGMNALKAIKSKNTLKPSNKDEESSSTELLPDPESEDGLFSSGKYLFYSGGGDRCKSMNQYIWGFMCMLGEAQFLNRTLVMDLKLCLSKMYTSSGEDEEGKDFQFYFDYEHLMDTAMVIEQNLFWTKWNKKRKEDGLTLHSVDSYRVTPMKLADVEDTLIVRKFGSVESGNYWHQVCEGDAKSTIDRPWIKLWKARQLLDIAFAVAARLKWDYNGVSVERGEKAEDKERWPNLDTDTSPDALLSTLKQLKIEKGSNLYISTDERNTSLFDPLRNEYSIHFLDDHKDLWDSSSYWYEQMMKINGGKPVEFDGYMRASVDAEVFSRGKRQIQTFNDLTKDCKDGVNTCTATS